MIRFFIKGALMIAVVTVGGAVIVDRVPSLKANIFEVVNPRAKEQRLVEELQGNLQELSSILASTSAKTISARTKELVTESRDLVGQISDINTEHSGVANGIISKAIDALIGDPSSSLTIPTTPYPTRSGAPPPCYP